MATKLSTVERVILYNQNRILEKLDPDNADSYQKAQEVLLNGYEYLYDRVAIGGGFSDAMPEKESQYVMDVLQMFRELKGTVRERGTIPGVSDADIQFKGFDGNMETSWYGFAGFVLDTLGLFAESKSDIRNSHSPTSHRYGPMLAKWKEIRSRPDYSFPHTAAAVKAIVDAGK